MLGSDDPHLLLKLSHRFLELGLVPLLLRLLEQTCLSTLELQLLESELVNLLLDRSKESMRPLLLRSAQANQRSRGTAEGTALDWLQPSV